jgi:hypothetical protein
MTQRFIDKYLIDLSLEVKYLNINIFYLFKEFMLKDLLH